MMTFILLAVLIIIVCLAIMLAPFLKSQNSDALKRDDQNIHFAKSRLAELDEQRRAATISQADYDNLRLEIETTLADDIDLDEIEEDAQSINIKQSNGVLITLLATLIPFSALILYQLTGTPAAINPNNLVLQTEQVAPGMPDQAAVNEMVVAIEQRLQENPQDSQGWAILSRTYMVMQRYQDAFNANLKLLELEGESAEIYAQLADSASMIAGGKIAGQPSAYIKQALAIDPVYPQALWLAGLESAQAGNIVQAGNYWNTLLPLLANSPEQQQELREIIEQTIGVQVAAEITTNTAQVPEIVNNIGLEVNVAISQDMQSQVAPNDTVFVFARAQNGPPAPLAVKRLSVADLPTQIQLSDSDAMLEQFKLSLFEDVVVLARISKSGDPIAQSGDIQSNTINTKNNSQDVLKLVISELVKE